MGIIITIKVIRSELNLSVYSIQNMSNLAKFNVLKKLGEGSFSEVYRV